MFLCVCVPAADPWGLGTWLMLIQVYRLALILGHVSETHVNHSVCFSAWHHGVGGGDSNCAVRSL